jgi:hypothetical protein
MTRHVYRWAGVLFAVIAVIAGVMAGRVIEAIAVAAVLVAGWSYVRGLTA